MPIALPPTDTSADLTRKPPMKNVPPPHCTGPIIANESMVQVERPEEEATFLAQEGEQHDEHNVAAFTAPKGILQRLQGRKYFDSGDYAMALQKGSNPAKHGGSTATNPLMMVGRLHPSPERILHSTSSGSIGKSPMKEHVVSSDSLVLLGTTEEDDGAEMAVSEETNLDMGDFTPPPLQTLDQQ